MSILTSTPVNTPTKEQELKQVSDRIKFLTSQTFKNLVDVQKNGINLVWNQRNLTPQEILDYLGEDAMKVFQFHGALTDLIVSIATSEGVSVDLKTPTNAFTVGQDGKITVTDQPYQG